MERLLIKDRLESFERMDGHVGGVDRGSLVPGTPLWYHCTTTLSPPHVGLVVSGIPFLLLSSLNFKIKPRTNRNDRGTRDSLQGPSLAHDTPTESGICKQRKQTTCRQGESRNQINHIMINIYAIYSKYDKDHRITVHSAKLEKRKEQLNFVVNSTHILKKEKCYKTNCLVNERGWGWAVLTAQLLLHKTTEGHGSSCVHQSQEFLFCI